MSPLIPLRSCTVKLSLMIIIDTGRHWRGAVATIAELENKSKVWNTEYELHRHSPRLSHKHFYLWMCYYNILWINL